jgi:hypothetical protein
VCGIEGIGDKIEGQGAVSGSREGECVYMTLLRGLTSSKCYSEKREDKKQGEKRRRAGEMSH